MTNTIAVRLAALLGFLALVLGAFGAHALKDTLVRHDAVAIWEKAVFYHFLHAVMMFVLAQQRPVHFGPWVSFLIGILLFSGSLYGLALTNAHWLGAITPFGGVSFLVGWSWLALRAGKSGACSA